MGYKILSTKKLSKETLNIALGKNITLDEIPFITTAPIKDEALKVKLKGFLQQNINAVFTSQNAVKAFEQIANAGVPWEIFSLGHTTAKAVGKTFGEEKISGRANDASELATLISQDKEIKEVVFFCGDQRREELPAILKEAGLAVNEVVVYSTLETPQKLPRKPYDGILFFSPSAVKSFLSMNKLDKQTQLFAIGKTTAAAITTPPGKKVIIADTPSEEKMIDIALAHFNTIK